MEENKTAEFLKQLRHEKGLTQEKLAEILYIGREAISKWERGVTTPDIDSLHAISAYFNVSIDEILKGGRIEKEEIEPETIIINNTKKSIITSIICIIVITIFLIISFIIVYKKYVPKTYEYSYDSDNFVIKEMDVTKNYNISIIKTSEITSSKGEKIKYLVLFNNNNLIAKTSDHYFSFETTIPIDINEFKLVVITDKREEEIILTKRD